MRGAMLVLKWTLYAAWPGVIHAHQLLLSQLRTDLLTLMWAVGAPCSTEHIHACHNMLDFAETAGMPYFSSCAENMTEPVKYYAAR